MLTLVLGSGAVGLLLALLTLLIAPLVLALPGLTATAVVRVAAAQLLTAWVVVLIASVVVVSSVSGIHVSLLHASTGDHAVSPPPARAVRMAFRAPALMVWIVTLVAQATALGDVLGYWSLSGLMGWPGVAVPLMSVAISFAGLHPSIMLWRAVLWRWLARLHPHDVPHFKPGRLAHRLAWTAAVPVAMVGLSASVVLLSQLFAFHAQRREPIELLPSPWWTDPATPLCAFLITVGGGLTTWLLVRRVGQRTATDLLRLTEEIQRVQRRGGPSTRAQLAVFELIPHTTAGVALGRSLAELAGRFSEIAEQEQQAGLAMESVRRLRTQFLASMSHDLRSPLNSIVGFSDLVDGEVDGPLTDEQRESVTMVRRSAWDLLRLVNHILDWARLDAGRFEVATERVDAGSWLDEVTEQAERMLGEGPLRLRVEVSSELENLLMHLDARRMAEGLLAVVEHAASMMEEGQIELTACLEATADDAEEPLVQICVTDYGPGVRLTDLPLMFQAFREIQDTQGKRVGGLGVGLAVAREVARAHGGELEFSSSGSGVGSTFTLSLPLPHGGAPMLGSRTLAPPA